MVKKFNTHLDEAVLILGHGSRLPEGLAVITETAARYALEHPTLYVDYAFMELATPTLREVIPKTIAKGVKKITVVPLFLSFGHHIATDLPKIMADMTATYPEVCFVTTPPIGADPLLCQIIEARVKNSTT